MSDLDHLVKGTPPGNQIIQASPTNGLVPSGKADASPMQDSLASLPSSPPQIYLNLLILEASLRLQWLQLRTRRRQHTFFLTLLAFWILYFGYALFLAPREDGSGVGGSVYWVVEVVEKLCFLGGIVTGVLVWGTGQWERGVRWPRRWVYSTNRGLRGFNCKLVVIKQPWWIELFSMISFLFSYDLLSGSCESSYRHVDQRFLKETDKTQKSGSNATFSNKKDFDSEGYDEDLAPGGDYVKLLLLPKPFSPNFRQNWDIYRTEYWERENERRAILRKAIRDREKKIAKHQGGYLWWIGYRGWNKTRNLESERTNQFQYKPGLTEKEKQRISGASLKSGSHSRNSSQDVNNIEMETGKCIRGSGTVSKLSGKQKSGKSGKSQRHTTAHSRSLTMEASSPLKRQSSFMSVSSVDSEQASVSTSPAVFKN